MINGTKKIFKLSKKLPSLVDFRTTHNSMRLKYEIWRVEKGPTVESYLLNRRIDQNCGMIRHYVIQTNSLKVCLHFDFVRIFNCHWIEILHMNLLFGRIFAVFYLFELGKLFTISFEVKFLFECSNYFVRVNVFFFEFLVMGTALKAISSANEVRHLFVELIGS